MESSAKGSGKAPEKKPAKETAGAGKKAAEGNRDVVSAQAAAADEKKALENRLLRLQADFDNFRKRVERERKELADRILEEFVTELLSVVDHFELGLRAAEQHEKNAAVVEGFRHVYRELMRLLEKHGVRPMEVVGKPFDPEIHDAVAQIPSDEYPENVVIAEVRRGYTMDGRLLRVARVVVSSGPPAEGDTAAGEESDQ